MKFVAGVDIGNATTEVALANVNAQLDQRFVDHRLECIGRFRVGGALDGNCSLVVGVRGGAPRAVLFLHIKTHRAVKGNAVIR